MSRHERTSTPAFTMPPGTYFIGDPCYVLDDEWDEVCELIIKDRECVEGKFNLSSGREFSSFNTAYGDGTYLDQFSHKYAVDSGSIGCVRLLDGESPRGDLGQLCVFDSPFIVERRGDVIYIGHLSIDTGDDEPDGWQDHHVDDADSYDD